MKRDELIDRVAARSYLTRAEAYRAVDAVFAIIGDAAVRGETVSVNRFGIFSVKTIEAREGRNPRTGEQISISRKRKLTFRPSKAMRDELQEGQERQSQKREHPAFVERKADLARTSMQARQGYSNDEVEADFVSCRARVADQA